MHETGWPYHPTALAPLSTLPRPPYFGVLGVKLPRATYNLQDSGRVSPNRHAMSPNNRNVPAEGIPYFTPAQVPPAGSAYATQPEGVPIPLLFQPLRIRGVEFQNRIWVRSSIILRLKGAPSHFFSL